MRTEPINPQTIVLVVDDFEPIRRITVGQLRAIGFTNILTANNGAQALRMLRTRRVDLVLSEWDTPVMTGLELLRAVRLDERLASLPFMMMTAKADRHRIAEAIAHAVSDLLIKPYTADHLATRVERALSARPPSSSTGVAIQPTRAASSDAEGELVRPIILVVDDTPDNLLLLSHLFQDDYRVRTATSGDKALAICQSSKAPDLVLLDVMMPGMDGFEVARRMREHPTSETIPIIFVTGMSDQAARLQGLALGAVDFVSKPIDPDVLKPRVRNFMRYVALHKQLQAEYDSMQELARLREDVERITRHDLKGPLGGVIAMLQTLVADDTMNRAQVGELRRAEEATLQVLDLINLSSELFKIETGRFELDACPVRISNILQRIADMAGVAFAAKGVSVRAITLVADDAAVPKALGDDLLCYSLFQNLVKNACEAAPPNSEVSITLLDATPLQIVIENQGAVPAEIRARFFNKFVTHGKKAGTGFGTYSARMLTQAQNGSIALAVSDAQSLTTITVSLPRYCEEPPAAVSASSC